MAQEKEPFISSEERPSGGLNPDAPISELRVRDLQTLLQSARDYKIWPEVKFEIKGKFELQDHKNPLKTEQREVGGEMISPVIDQLVRTVSGLREQVTQLTQEVEKLKQQPDKG